MIFDNVSSCWFHFNGFAGEALWPSHNPKRSCTNLWGTCEFPYSFAAWCWSIWAIFHIRWASVSACYLFRQVQLLRFCLPIYLVGGEDCNLRLWSIKSGELLFEDKLTNTVTSTVCWRKAECNFCLLYSHSQCIFSFFMLLGNIQTFTPSSNLFTFNFQLLYSV